ncbi:MAG: leucine-rich repeat domain-containing protein, partial [Prevotella sp.]|nr:leucine-rich repeat domain-containing protein [Prevotella sp.]
EYPSLKELDLKATTITTFEGAFVLTDSWKTITYPNILRLPSSTQTTIGSEHLKFTSLNGLTLLDISALNLTDEQVGYLTTNNGSSNCNVLDKKNLDSKSLKERWGAKYFNVFSPKETAASEPSEINVFVGNISTLDLAGNASDYDNVVVSSSDPNIFGNVEYMKTFMTKVNGVTGIKNLVLAKVATYGSQNYDITSLTNTEVLRIIMPDNQDLDKVTNASHKPILQSYDTNTTKETLLVTNAGDLEKIQNAHYYSTDIDNAYWQEYKGNLNAKDILFLNNIKAKRLNIANAKYPKEDSEYEEFISALKNYKNSTIEYLALPKNCLTLEVTNKDDFNYQSNVNLIGVGVFMEEVNAENTVPTLHTYTKYNSDKTKKGEIAALIEMMGLSSSKTNIKRIVFSGYLDASDIGGYVSGQYSIGTDGHLYHETIKIKPEGMETNNSGDLNGATPESADFSKAYFNEPFDMCINGSCIATYKEIKLPLTMTEIPENFITGCSNITELYIPYGYETVGKNALLGCNISRIYTDETKNNDGTKYMAGNNGDHTMTLPASLKKISTGAFAISDNVDIYDVYILAETAPICEMDAFSSAMYFNNNSYNPTTPITAESYQKGGGTSSMSVLHFPTKCNTENVKKYTDPTREYTLADGLATTDANGNLLYWPNQSEFNTAYIQAVTGYTWKSWKIERVTYSTEIGNCLIPSGTSGSAVKDGAQEEAYAKFQENGSPADTQYWTESSEEDYRGWHQFVLTSFSKSKNEDPTFNFGYITDNDWWTICLPFDMTKAKLKEVYGENTKVCTLVNVVRSYNGSDANYPKNSVTLVFGNNLMEKTDDSEPSTVNGADVVIKAGYPYMIKPSLSTKQMENPKELLVFSDPSYATKLEEGKTAAYQILTTEKNIKARKETLNGDVDNDYTYRFIGSFVPYYMPQHSYFLGWDTKQDGVAFFYQAEMPSSNIKNWNAYTCVIGVNWDKPKWMEATLNDVSHWETYTVSGSNMISVSEDDSFPSAANGKITNMQFGTGETDAIETVHMGNKTVTFVSGRVYNLNGQVVGENGNIDHLGKGIYVVNGKKFVVK